MAEATIPRIGVYRITNTVTGSVYVGSSNDIPARWRTHRRHLRKVRHHSRRLQKCWDEHGEAAFVFSVLEAVSDIDTLWDREKFWIDELGAVRRPGGLNISLFPGSPRGITRTAETRARMAASKVGVKRPSWFSDMCRSRMLASHASEATKAKMREARSGVPQRSKRGLTYEDAVEIRRLRQQYGLTQAQLAARFGVTRNPIREILAGRTYSAP